MKRLFMLSMCFLAIMAASLSAKAQEVTITLFPGCTWISYPKAEVMDVATALGDFVPTNGDVIKSQFSYTTYSNGHWRGGLTHFIPGWGYMYYSNREEPVSFVFASSTPQSQVQVTTSEPMLITGISAMGGGEVTVSDGTYILVKGLCWATHENPTTNEDFYQEAESGVGTFSVSMTGLNISTMYYVRAYAVTPNGTVYGDQKTFSTLEGYVDLGLPSGTLWATCNVGTDIPEGNGDFFAWGETQPKSIYDLSTYQYYHGSNLTKYTGSDGLTNLLPEDDAAMANWGSDWRMPTQAEWQELYSKTTVTWTQQNGVNGRLFTAANGNSLFLPAAGRYEGSYHYSNEGYGNYWSSSLDTNSINNAWCYQFGSGNSFMNRFSRWTGQSVRAVRSGYKISIIINPSEGGEVSGGSTYRQGDECTLTATAKEGFTFTSWTENGVVISFDTIYTFMVNADRTIIANFAIDGMVHNQDYVDLGLPSGLLWATCNVGANTPEEYGKYFAWGEVWNKSVYNWSTYQYSNSSDTLLTKYCNNSNYGYNGFTDDLTVLLPEDDAATANWGNGWRMPTKEDWQELFSNTTCSWTTQNGVNGTLFTAFNGNSLFLPAAGYCSESALMSVGNYGYYWSSSVDTDRPDYVWEFHIRDTSMHPTARYFGQTVRAVRVGSQN